jgi:hypothetical protein
MLEFLKKCSNYKKDALAIFPDIADAPKEKKGASQVSMIRDKSQVLRTSRSGDVKCIAASFVHAQSISYEDLINGEIEIKTIFAAPVMSPNMNEEEFFAKKQSLMIKSKEIINIIISENIIFPAKIVNSVKLPSSNGILHPDLFEAARSHLSFKLTQDDFSEFIQVVSRNTFSAVNAEPPQFTINQLVLGELNEPYTYESIAYLI